MYFSDGLSTGRQALSSIIIGNGQVSVNIAQALAAIQSLPNTVTQSQFDDFINLVEQFLKSRQASMVPELTRQQLQGSLVAAQRMPLMDGWTQLRSFLTEYRIATQLAAPLILFVANNPYIVPGWMVNLVGQITT